MPGCCTARLDAEVEGQSPRGAGGGLRPLPPRRALPREESSPLPPHGSFSSWDVLINASEDIVPASPGDLPLRVHTAPTVCSNLGGKHKGFVFPTPPTTLVGGIS